MKVVVVGGGVAGMAAALAASRSGAETTLVEGSWSLGLNRSLLPYLIAGRTAPDEISPADPAELTSAGVEVRLGESVTRVDTGASAAHTSAGQLRFDALVLATGSRYIAEEVRGIGKQGVFVMRSAEDYVALSRSVDSVSSVAVLGPAPLSLVVADELSCRTRVRVFLGAQGLPFSKPVREAISRAASGRGVELLGARVEAVVGTRRAEAVISGGAVYPSDAVVVLPKGAPSVPEAECVRGYHGGLLVDHSMHTSARCVFAAGDCAELRVGCTSLPSRLHSSSVVMGKVAGINAAGGGPVRARIARSMSLVVFGLEVCAAGLDAGEGAMVGLDTVETELLAGEMYVSLVYDRVTQRVHGVQAAGPGALSFSDCASLAVSAGVRLEDLAYRDSPYLPHFNTDEPPIRLTAGRALASSREPTFEAQGTHLRPGRPGRPRAP